MRHVTALFTLTFALAGGTAFAQLPLPLGDLVDEICEILRGGASGTADCETLLGDNLYRCRIARDDGTDDETCLQADSSSPQYSTSFDLGGIYACSCDARGTADDPEFAASDEFVCVTSSFAGAPTHGLHGVVSEQGNRITATTVFPDGKSALYECMLDPECPVAPPTDPTEPAAASPTPTPAPTDTPPPVPTQTPQCVTDEDCPSGFCDDDGTCGSLSSPGGGGGGG